MTMTALARARAGDGDAFRELTDPYQHELQLHCYRILGSVQDAEDMLQETLLAAWRGIGQYEARASLRTWLYRIATNRCLNALRASGRRPRPEPPEPPFEAVTPTRRGEPVWLQPYPDALLDGMPDTTAGPDARYEAKETIALAFVAALQHLPPRQRAVLLLRDALGFRSAEVADMLDTSEASVNSALQRARATMTAALPLRDRERAALPRSAKERDLAERFAAAFADDDIEGVVALLTYDAWFTMPPATLEYQGPHGDRQLPDAKLALPRQPAHPADPDPGEWPASVRLLRTGRAHADLPPARHHGANHGRRPDFRDNPLHRQRPAAALRPAAHYRAVATPVQSRLGS